MTRAVTLCAVFGFCFAVWTAIYMGGVFAVVRGFSWIAHADAGGVVAASLTLGGLAMILIGAWLRHVGKSIDDPLRFPLMSSARFVVGIGALVTFGGAGAVLVNGVG